MIKAKIKYIDLLLYILFTLSVILEFFDIKYYALLRIIFLIGLFLSIYYKKKNKEEVLDLHKSNILELIQSILFFISFILYDVSIIL